MFNIVAGCTDAHTKNYSLMLEGASVRLAPLYDLLTYAAYGDGQAKLDSAMSIGGDYSLRQISIARLQLAGKQFGVDAELAADIVDGVRVDLVEAFDSARSAVVQSNKKESTWPTHW